jgi:putative tryptophan/tyrosine transport system substrate-binding protein
VRVSNRTNCFPLTLLRLAPRHSLFKSPNGFTPIGLFWGHKQLIAVLIIAAVILFPMTLAHAQQLGKVFRIGFLDVSTASGMAVLIDAFREELSKLGWNEGKNFTIEYRFTEGKNDRLPELAADLVRSKVDLIVVTGGPVAVAAKKRPLRFPS